MHEDPLDARKPLPLPGRDEKLPPTPPDTQEPSVSPPPLPPKIALESNSEYPRLKTGPEIMSISSDSALAAPSNPTTPTTPTSFNSAAEVKPKKTNPLIDLVDTEKAYVDQLTGIIRKIAAAWSRSNLPPAELDRIFRSIESVCKANRSLLSKLKDIGTNPSSPKALGDLLMRWVDDLESPYTAYCSNYCTGFDTWNLILSNERLPTILANFSVSNPPPPILIVDPCEPPTWTLDTLFLLPKVRLKYYKKLYGRLLKSTAPGRSDHRLLVGALDKLDKLLSTLEDRTSLKAGTSSPPSIPPVEPMDEVVIDMRSSSMSNDGGQVEQPRTSVIDTVPGSENSSVRGSSLSSGERFSRETASTSVSRGSRTTMTTPIVDLERRLATERTLDIFTMNPKVVRLQMAPPSLQYTRELRFSIDVVVRLIPRSTGVEIIHRHGHVFLLSDLFLVCERMTPEERSRGADGPDMWLCYPPLAGKVLRVSEVSDKENALEIVIMKKETLILETDSIHIRDFMMAEFRECIDFATSVVVNERQTPPPLPPPPIQDGFSPSPLVPIPSNRPPRGLPRNPRSDRESKSSSTQGPHQSASGPAAVNRPGETISMAPQQGSSRLPPNSTRDGRVPEIMTKVGPPPEAQGQPVAQRVLSLRDPLPNSPYPPRSVSAQPLSAPRIPPNTGQVFTPPNRGFGPSHEVRAGPNIQPAPFKQNTLPNSTTNQPYPPHQQAPFLPPYTATQGRGPSDPTFQGGLRKSPSSPSLVSQYTQPGQGPTPAMPSLSNGYPSLNINTSNTTRNDSYGPLLAPQPRPMLPSALNVRSVSMVPSFHDPSPPNSPVEETLPTGPLTSTISAQMKCKVFLQQQHAQWKSLGAAKLKLYNQRPTNVKQLVVEADNKGKSILISTIVLTDGVERVGKTGVAVELSDKGTRTGIVYMIQLRNETSAGGLFNSLLEGSDRAGSK